MTTLHPEVLWAQRSSESDETKNVIYLTVNLTEIQESALEYTLEPTKISFKAKSGNDNTGSVKEYAFALDFFAEIVPEKSSKKLTTRSFYLVLRKKEQQAEYWPRLTKEKVKNAFIKTDFSKWVDEDEQMGEDAKDDEDLDNAMGGMGGMPPGMGGMGGMPGMGGMGGGFPGMEGMGGMGGMGGMPGMPPGMDFEKMMKEMGGGGMGGGAGGPSGFGGDDDGDDSDDDGPPPLEDAEPAK
ncbi:HSP20-like chaperone [Mycena belliarum]|uniref:HSP20-like chaperone n=1 Tax=Mycena belliarum TaxID=1033014 RepID=A0AAD6UL05_9AGAR|nr:HSP20-like chaperone [Mycena belliae]